MRKVIVMLLLAVVSSSAAAEWVRVGETGISVTYYDPAKTQKNGAIHRVWVLQDFKQKAPDGVMSMRSLEEFDCKENRFRGISGFMYSKPMATGRTLASINTPSEWDRDLGSPSSSAKIMLKIVCAR